MPRPRLIKLLVKVWDPHYREWTEEKERSVDKDHKMFPLFQDGTVESVIIGRTEKKWDPVKERVSHYIWMEIWRVPDPLPVAGKM